MLKRPENITPEVQQILDNYDAEQKAIQSQHNKALGRIGGGTALMGLSALPIFNVPYVGTGVGGALYELGQGITEGDKLPELAKRTGAGFAIGEAVGFMPPAIQRLSKTKAGQAIGELGQGLGKKFMDSSLGQKVAEIAPKVEDLLMTDIKAFNPNKQTVYHGSPYDFAKFSNEAIGTGEGAQAHGYGHYAAKNKGMGERYRQTLSSIPYNEKIQSRLWSDLKNDRIPQLKNNEEKELFEFISSNLQPSEFNTRRLKHYFDDLETPQAKEYADILLNELENNNNQGQLYKLSIPKDDVMLREDLPFSEQPEAVRKAMENIANTYNDTFESDMLLQAINKNKKGKQFYRDLEFELGQDWKAAGEELYNNGIKGISYNGGIDGEANVIFNPDDIDIVRKYYNQPSLAEFVRNRVPNMGAITNSLIDE